MNQRRRSQKQGVARWRGLGTRAVLGLAVAAFLTGCAGTVSTGYVGEPYYDSGYPYAYGYPYDYGYYGPDVYIGGGYPYYDHHFGHEYYHRGFDYHRSFEGQRAAAPHAIPHAGGFSGTYRGTGHGGSRDHR